MYRRIQYKELQLRIEEPSPGLVLAEASDQRSSASWTESGDVRFLHSGACPRCVDEPFDELRIHFVVEKGM